MNNLVKCIGTAFPIFLNGKYYNLYLKYFCMENTIEGYTFDML